ncbi:DUF4129 domain-containing protein [Croceivirga thetidis]|uniref:DUF4129 domain-containing protein n=1 Tax=Croceivirga thetidis TaxID=2721623 RepID=A0ABX1GPN9_9FLAO|nr:DUF4129 domain-containing protein [Croceivirga thetidis]
MRITILLFLCSFFGFTQVEKDSLSLAEDKNSILQERNFEDGLNERYSGEEFDYTIKTGESANLISRFLRWFGNWLNDTFGIQIPPGTLEVLKWLIYIVMGGLVIFLIVRMFVNERFEAIFSKKAKSFADIELAEQHIEAIDFDSLLKDALKNKDYRLAVRYHFLKLLKRLSQKELIEWHFEKTNSEYHQEIQEPKLQSGFKELAYLYDYVWYGEQPITESLFSRAANQFEKMNQIIPR